MQPGRPVIEASTLWNLEPIDWMLKGGQAVKDDVDWLLKGRAETDGFVQFARGVSGLLLQAKKGQQDHGLSDDMQGAIKKVEERKIAWKCRTVQYSIPDHIISYQYMSYHMISHQIDPYHIMSV